MPTEESTSKWQSTYGFLNPLLTTAKHPIHALRKSLGPHPLWINLASSIGAAAPLTFLITAIDVAILEKARESSGSQPHLKQEKPLRFTTMMQNPVQIIKGMQSYPVFCSIGRNFYSYIRHPLRTIKYPPFLAVLGLYTGTYFLMSTSNQITKKVKEDACGAKKSLQKTLPKQVAHKAVEIIEKNPGPFQTILSTSYNMPVCIKKDFIILSMFSRAIDTPRKIAGFRPISLFAIRDGVTLYAATAGKDRFAKTLMTKFNLPEKSATNWAQFFCVEASQLFTIIPHIMGAKFERHPELSYSNAFSSAMQRYYLLLARMFRVCPPLVLGPILQRSIRDFLTGNPTFQPTDIPPMSNTEPSDAPTSKSTPG